MEVMIILAIMAMAIVISMTSPILRRSWTPFAA